MTLSRTILDTNVALDVFVFARDENLMLLRQAVTDKQMDCIATAAMRLEFERVLRMDKLRLDDEKRTEALRRYDAAIRIVGEASGEQAVPRCSDRDDQIFIDLAVHADAAWLLSRDKAVLKLRKRFVKLELPTQILHPLQWALPA